MNTVTNRSALLTLTPPQQQLCTPLFVDLALADVQAANASLLAHKRRLQDSILSCIMHGHKKQVDAVMSQQSSPYVSSVCAACPLCHLDCKGVTVMSVHDLLLLLSCRDADLLLIANKGGFAFAVDPDTGDRVWATAVGKASQSFQ